MDAFRKQLDALMGANRNGDVIEVHRNYWDRDVCRLFLCGLCPHDLFNLTKMDLGPCPNVHSLHLRKEYEAARSKGKDSYEREVEEVLEKHVVECDRKIQRSLKRLEDDSADGAIAVAVSEVTKSKASDDITKQIKEKLKAAEIFEMEGNTDEKIRVMDEVEELRQKRADVQALSILDAFNKDRMSTPPGGAGGGGGPPSMANLPPTAFPGTQLVIGPPDARTQEMIKEKLKKAEELGEEGLVDEAQKMLEEAEALKKLGSRPDPGGSLLPMAGGNIQIADQKLRVCDICGAFLSIYDSDRRLADHFGGKLHLGYMVIREKLEELKELRLSAPKKEEISKVSREREKSREKSRERGRDRSREREREKERGRGRSGRERERDRGGRSRSRSRERSHRDHDRHRDRDDRRRRDRY